MKVKWIDAGMPEIIIKEELYEVTDLPLTHVDSNSFLKDRNENEIKKRIEEIIEQEAPITEWLLIKRLINSFGILKAGTHIRKKMFDILDGMELNKSEEYDKTIYWKQTQRPTRYKRFRLPGSDEESARDVTNIPIIEISNAVYKVLVDEGSLKYDDLARLTALKLRYTRMGSNVKQSIKRAINMATKRYPIQVKDNIYCAFESDSMLK